MPLRDVRIDWKQVVNKSKMPLNIAVIPFPVLVSDAEQPRKPATACTRWSSNFPLIPPQQPYANSSGNSFAIGEKQPQKQKKLIPIRSPMTCENEQRFFYDDDRVINLQFTGGIGSFSFSSVEGDAPTNQQYLSALVSSLGSAGKAILNALLHSTPLITTLDLVDYIPTVPITIYPQGAATKSSHLASNRG